VRHAFSPQLERLGAARALEMERTNLHKRIRALGLSRGK
jgi:transcriptional regulator with GAF, ATPase, and Fis domain